MKKEIKVNGLTATKLNKLNSLLDEANLQQLSGTAFKLSMLVQKKMKEEQKLEEKVK